MSHPLDRFILGIPRLYIKQFPYAWIVFIALWAWTPGLQLIFLFIILLGYFLLAWQYRAWMRSMRGKHAPEKGKFYVDRPAVPLERSVRNIAILAAVGGAASYFLQGQFGLTFWQLFLIIVGFTLMYRNALFFGASVTYFISATGIGIFHAPGHLDYRLFFEFNEISRIERCAYKDDLSWVNFSRIPNPKEGLLLTPKNPNGFSKRMRKIFIAPMDIEKFREQLPYGFK